MLINNKYKILNRIKIAKSHFSIYYLVFNKATQEAL